MNESPSRIAALIEELKRRHVLNVAVVYLVGMWLVIQVADITFTRLGLPDWTVTFVIVLGALMFPVVVTLAWAFDLTRAGITRTPARAAGDDVATSAGVDASDYGSGGATGGGSSAFATSGVAPGDGSRTHRHQRRVAVALAALMTVPLLGFGIWWTGIRGARGANLDRNLIAVTPFRLAGASSELGYLREGLMDLIAARIGGAGGELNVVPPRSVSRSIKESLGSLDADPDRDESRKIAIGYGAGLLLEGEVVGRAERFTVTARLFDVRTGYRLDTAELEAEADNLHDLVDRIAARLVAAESGLRGDRLAALTTASLPALHAFLDGEQAFRRGDHDRAVRGYDRAVTLDSTFSLAALGLLRAHGWAVGLTSDNAGRAEAIVRRGLDRLSEADRLYFNAAHGAEGPDRYRDIIDRRIHAADRMPTLAELQYLAGDGVLHYGEAVGIPDAIGTAIRYFERTVALDSTYIEPLIHLHDLSTWRDDIAGVRRYGDLLLALDSTGPIATGVRVARARGKAGLTSHPPVAFDTLDLPQLLATVTSDWMERPDTDRTAAFQRLLREAATSQDRVRVAGLVLFEGVMLGRPSMVAEARTALADAGRDDDVQHLALAIYWLRDLDAARGAAADVQRNLVTARREANGDATVPFAVTGRECMLGHLSIAQGDEARALQHAGVIAQAVSTGRDLWWNAWDRTCANFLTTAAAVQRRSPDALQLMEALHDSLGAGSPRPASLYPAYDLASVQLWEQLGRPDRALEAARRRVHLPLQAIWNSTLDGENARLADQLGHRDEAISIHARYLRWLEGGEGVFVERAAHARDALQRLMGQG